MASRHRQMTRSSELRKGFHHSWHDLTSLNFKDLGWWSNEKCHQKATFVTSCKLLSIFQTKTIKKRCASSAKVT